MARKEMALQTASHTILILLCATMAASVLGQTGGKAIKVPEVPGLKVEVGETFVIPGATNTIAHRFQDGRIVVMGADKDIWSDDGGRTWRTGPQGPTSKTVLDLGNGEVLSFGAHTQQRPDGKYEVVVTRSRDSWATQTEETAIFDTPQATFTGGDDGGKHPGMIVHHGAIQLKNGDLMVSMYGNYRGDTELADAYPVEFNLRKYRTIVIFSSDRGKTWRNPVTVAYAHMLARGLDPDTRVVSYCAVPAVTQEGFGEADLARASNGDILCMMRSGGRIAVGHVPIFPTPLYLSRSSDEGQTWSTPVQVADRGVCPYLMTLDNGVIVCAYARPGNWLIFSDDHGHTWKGAFQFGTSDSYCNVLAVGPDQIMAVYHADRKIFGTFFRVTRK
ncbi:MAG: exo-alpha-sialidase [Planctomycetes bacterium]|nr:exo-alpha-sialidase [Planctomycetota bacterium]